MFRDLFVKPAKIALYNLKHNILSIKFIIITFIMGYYYYKAYSGLWEAAARTGEGVSAFLVPAMLSFTETYIIFILCFVAFIGDMPFHNENLIFIRARAGRMRVFAANIITVAVSAIFFTAYIYVMNFLCFILKPEFTGGWGRNIETVYAGEQVIHLSGPAEAVLRNIALLLMVYMLLGSTVLAANSIFNNYAGTIAAASLVFISEFIYYMRQRYGVRADFIDIVGWNGADVISAGRAAAYALAEVLIILIILGIYEKIFHKNI